MEKERIGAVETVCIPDLNQLIVEAKVDTGAKSSALHCDSIRLEGDTVHFTVDGKQPGIRHEYSLRAAMIETVRSSNGMAQQRIFITLTVELGNVAVQTLVSLTDRSKMRYPMLLGRRFLSGRFLVDCSEKHLWKERSC